MVPEDDEGDRQPTHQTRRDGTEMHPFYGYNIEFWIFLIKDCKKCVIFEG
jgi:hypothetical protein